MIWTVFRLSSWDITAGWNHHPAELAEQQEQILNTFQNKDQFIVVGTRPLDGNCNF